MSTLMNLWVVPTRHKELSQRYNTTMPIHVPISRAISEDKISTLTEMIPKRTIIKNCGDKLKLMMNTEHEYALGYDCKVFDYQSVLVMYEIMGEVAPADIPTMFPELSPVEEELEATLCLSMRSMEYPFGWELLEL
jgi:hypothetical protein